MKRVAIFGTGYVGCVTAACLARDGHHVIGVDIDQDKVTAINSGQSPVEEAGLADLIAEQVAAGRLSATADVSAAVDATELAMIAVGTPSQKDGGISIDALERVVTAIGSELRGKEKPYTIVVRSTLLPGLLETRLAPLLEQAVGSDSGNIVQLCNNPEFLRESTAIRDYDNPPFVVVGTMTGEGGEEVLELYGSLAADRIVTDTRTAAMLKYACNAFHALKVSFANEIGALAKAMNADGHKVMDLLCKDDKLNISPAYLRPGFAFGGSCLPKDLRALVRFAQREAIDLDLLNATLASNDSQLQRAEEIIQSSGHRSIGLVGLSFKAGTDDLRESPQVRLAEMLVGRGFDLKIYDPGVSVTRLRGGNLAYVDRHLPHLAALLVENPEELINHAQLLVLATDIARGFNWHDAFEGDIIDLRSDLAV